jgi:o-succinylbenzoate synthase
MRPFSLPLRQPLETAHGRIDSREGWLVELEDEDGLLGFGEATPLPEFGTEDLETCRRALEHDLARELSAEPLGESEPSVFETPCACAAIDSARLDLAAKRMGRSLAAEIRNRAGLRGSPAASVSVQALVGGTDPKEVEANARSAMAEGSTTYKLKLAVSSVCKDPGLDIDRVAALRGVVGSTARLRLDANEAWDRNEAEAALRALAPFEIDYVEQPVQRDDLAGLKSLSESSAIAVAADEALQGAGLDACLEARAASILIVKPAALGGVARSIEIFLRAQEMGLRVIWSTLIDGAVGRAGPLALAAGLGPAGEVHGLGTAGLLAADLDAGLAGSGKRGGESQTGARMASAVRVEVPTDPGIGFEPRIPFASAKGLLSDDSTFEVES